MRRTERASSAPVDRHPKLDTDALLCALVLAPNTYARNRFYGMFEQQEMARVRRRAARVRGIIRQLSGRGRLPAEVVGEQVLHDRVVLRYRVENVNFARTTSLTLLEAALVHYALHKVSGHPLPAQERQLVEGALSRLGESLLI